MAEKYDKDDLIRKPTVRLIIWGLGLIGIVTASKSVAFNGVTWENIIFAIGSVFFLWIVYNAQENLIYEKNE